MSLVNFNRLEHIGIGLEKKVYAQPGTDTALSLGDITLTAAEIAIASASADMHYLSDGKVSLHEIVSELLKNRQGVNVWLSTFSFTETPARMLAKWKEDGIIKSLNVLLDVRGRANYPDVLQLLEKICDKLKLINTHAKVTIIEDNEEIICLTGSQNWTQNPRLEIGHITRNKSIANFHLNWIKNKLYEHFQ